MGLVLGARAPKTRNLNSFNLLISTSKSAWLLCAELTQLYARRLCTEGSEARE